MLEKKPWSNDPLGPFRSPEQFCKQLLRSPVSISWNLISWLSLVCMYHMNNIHQMYLIRKVREKSLMEWSPRAFSISWTILQISHRYHRLDLLYNFTSNSFYLLFRSPEIRPLDPLSCVCIIWTTSIKCIWSEAWANVNDGSDGSFENECREIEMSSNMN
jgi:hypothetical protein